jgi:hypothetical protein
MPDTYEIEISKYIVPDVVKVLRRHGFNNEANNADESVVKYGARSVTLAVSDWGAEVIEAVLPLLSDEKQARWYLQGYLKIVKNPVGAPVKKLEFLPKAMKQYLAQDAIDGWIYREVRDGIYVPYVVDIVEYRSGYRDNPPYVIMKLRANRARFRSEEEEEREGIQEVTESWGGYDLVHKATAATLLLKSGYLKESKALKAEYLKYMDLFKQYQPRDTKQFLCTGKAVEAGSKSWWEKGNRIYPLPHPTKMVNDEGVLYRKVTLECSNYHWEEFGVKSGNKAFGTVPVHPFILMFDLVRHEHVWIHVTDMKPYVYDPSLRDKMVLPEKHRDLIDVLTTDMDVFTEDIIAGKSGGTALLAYGEPGLGKTLTAEVYSELVERPLYRVHAGQLGTDVSTVEKELERVLRRAERWGAVLLLDEADVYIRRRSNDMDHNAVVAAFLRTLEYFHGLLFLTTNRASDVDDAILSRMAATFKYEIPDKDQAAAIWRIQAAQFGITLTDKAIELLVQEFSTASGRDIKQLLNLTSKYCKKRKVKMNMAAFRMCAMFRGLR